MNSALQRPLSFKLAAIAAAFLATLAVFMLLARGEPRARPVARDVAPLPPSASTDQRIAGYQRLAPRRAGGRRQLRGPRRRLPAEGARDRRPELLRPCGGRAAPRRTRRRAATTRCSPAWARWPWPGTTSAAACATGSRPGAPIPPPTCSFPVIVDALVELGRYDEAGRELQAFVDRKPAWPPTRGPPTSASCTATWPAPRRRCAWPSAPGRPPAARTSRTCRRCSATSSSTAGGSAAAGRAYRTALRSFPSYAAAQAGLARVEAARGATGAAIRRYRRLVARLPLPEHVVALGELELAAGRTAAGRRDLALVGAEQRLLRAGGREHRRRARASSRPTTARRARRSGWRGGPGRRRRACARPMRWAGRSRAPGGRAKGCPGRAAPCASARSTRASSTTPASPRSGPAIAPPLAAG